MTRRIKQLQIFRRTVASFVAVLVLAPVTIVWDSLPAASTSQSESSTSLFVVALAGSSSATLRAKVTSVPPSGEVPTGTVTFTIIGSGPVQCDGLPTDTEPMSGGVATCKVTSGLPASGSPLTAQATYSGDDNFIMSDGSYTSSDGTFLSGDTSSATTPLSSVFPVAVWLQDPAETNNIESGYSTLGAAAAAEGINTFLGFYDWPSAYGVDNSTGGQGSQFQAACNAGEYVIAGGDPSSNTSAESVASIEKIASDETQAGTGSSCTNYLAGYDWDDEPAECSTNVAAQVAAIHADDPTRPTVDNMASWVTWGDSGCDSTADENFSAPSFLSSDDYHNTDPWNVGSCTGAAHVSKSPWADCSWLYGYQGAIQTSLAAGKPTWEFIESGTDELGFSGQNGSTCNTTTNACSNGNEYNATAPQVNADAWSAIVNGVTGIEWFCHGTAQGQNLSDSDCMGGNGSASNAIFSNLRYIDDTIQSYAPELLSSTQGSCTMQPSTHSTIDNALLTSCSGGDLSITSSSSTEPIMGMTKVVNGTTYLFVEADRANGTTTGTYTISGTANQTATLVYDSAARYDPAASEQGDTFTLNSSGSFSDSLSGDNGTGSNDYGAGANGYQVKIFAIN